MARVIEIMPELSGEELVYMQQLLKDLSDEQARTFANVYRARRKEPNLILITALLGFLGFSGIHRFLLGDIGLGILYFFTVGLCFIGTIVDLVNYQKLAFEHNRKVANEVLMLVGS